MHVILFSTNYFVKLMVHTITHHETQEAQLLKKGGEMQRAEWEESREERK